MIIPEPKSVVLSEGISLTKGYIATNAGKLIKEELNQYSLGSACVENEKLFYVVISDSREIQLPGFPEELNQYIDGYVLISNEKSVIIMSRHPRGILYGWQVWKQLIKGQNLPCVNIVDYPDSEFRGFHMDLRIGFPKMERMFSIIDELSQYRYNIFLLEYENRFPYEEYADIVHHIHFSKEDIREIQEYAKERFIEIIPLQQTIGHLEYMLKIPKYNHLREVRTMPKSKQLYSLNGVGFKYYNDIDEICVSNEEAYQVVESLLKDMIIAHPDSKYIHLGCDEAWNLLSCSDCISRYGKEGKNQLYIEHINRMAELVSDMGKTPIIWDDMLRCFTRDELALINKNIVLMVWIYHGSSEKNKKIIEYFKEAGLQVLGASSVKCAEGGSPEYLDMPNHQLRMDNSDMWAELCKEEQLPGFCVTVWSNYTGTIAPPHPFFDTIWYGVVYAAEKLWNQDATQEVFQYKFVEHFFGVDNALPLFIGTETQILENLNYIHQNCIRHSYEAEVFKIMNLLKIYRLKSLAIERELYRFQMLISEAEYKMLRNRAEEVIAMREEIKPLVKKIVETYYTKEDGDIFIQSRFAKDELVYNMYLNLSGS